MHPVNRINEEALKGLSAYEKEENQSTIEFLFKLPKLPLMDERGVKVYKRPEMASQAGDMLEALSFQVRAMTEYQAQTMLALAHVIEKVNFQTDHSKPQLFSDDHFWCELWT